MNLTSLLFVNNNMCSVATFSLSFEKEEVQISFSFAQEFFNQFSPEQIAIELHWPNVVFLLCLIVCFLFCFVCFVFLGRFYAILCCDIN